MIVCAIAVFNIDYTVNSARDNQCKKISISYSSAIAVFKIDYGVNSAGVEFLYRSDCQKDESWLPNPKHSKYARG